MIAKIWILITFVTLALSSLSQAQTQANGKRSKTDESRLIDRAALQTQDRSIKTLTMMLKKYENTAREPIFLSRLGDLYLERSGLSFRISEGSLDKTKQGLWVESLTKSIGVYGTLIRKYPDFADTQYAYFKRGKAYKELKQTPQAKSDFLALVSKFPTFPMIDSAYMDLAEFAAENNQHQEALKYLGFVEKMKHSDYFVISLHKAAWSHFNLGNFEVALSYLSREIDYYYEAQKKSQEREAATGRAADVAFVEGAFNDFALFYFEAFNKKSSFAEIPDVVNRLKKLDRFEKYFGPSLFRFAKFLKAYDLIGPLNELEALLIKKYSKLPETAEVALIVFQYNFEKRYYGKLPKLVDDLKEIRDAQKSDALSKKLEQTLGLALKELHDLILKNKQSTELGILLEPLNALTRGMGQLLGEDHPGSLAARYALAETSFEIKDYQKATEGYRSLLEPKFKSILATKKLSLGQVSLRAISSRYQELKKNNVIPEKFPIVKRDADYPKNKFKSDTQDWIKWVSDHSALTNKKDPDSDKKSYLGFQLEAHRLLYHYFDRKEALDRLEDLAFDYPQSEYAIPALSIVLDTLSTEENWEPLFEVTQKAIKSKHWKDKPFAKQLFEMSSDAHFRITQILDKSKVPDEEKQAELIKRSKECISLFKESRILEQCQIIRAKAELTSKNYAAAEEEFTRLITALKSSPEDNKKKSPLLLLRSEARKQLGKSDLAIQDLEAFQMMNGYQDAEMTRTILNHYWFNRNYSALQNVQKQPKACQGKNSEICERYDAILKLLTDSKSKPNHSLLFKNATRGPKANASIWALMALKNPKSVPFQDRLLLLQKIGTSWEETDALTQVQILHILQDRVNQTLESVRISAPGIAPMGSDENSIARRMTLMKDIDSTFAKVMKLPWLEVKIKAASELAQVYQRLVQDLKSIQTPEDLLKPFQEKVKEITEATVSLEKMAKVYKAQLQGEPAQPGREPSSTIRKPETWLTSSAVLKLIPDAQQKFWKESVNEKRPESLFFIISQVELANKDFKDISNVLRGLTLVMSGAATEGHELIQSASSSEFRKQVLEHFLDRRKS